MGAAAKRAAATEVVAPPTIDISAAVASVLEEHGDVVSATNALHDKCEADFDLYKAVVNGHLRSLCRTLVQKAFLHERHAVWTESRPVAQLVSVEAFGAAVTRSLMDFPLFGGSRRLGDCARAHLVTAENGYQTQATDMQVKARWLRLIREALPDDNTTVRQALNDDALRDLKAKALNMREAV